jgi:N-acetylglucosaminyl-diphospho-decaprenol L-rhamnosyltransferase
MPKTVITPDSTFAQLKIEAARSVRPLDIAVVIVTYKSARLTLQALSALSGECATPGLSIRAVVVDNASGDLPEIARGVEQSGWSSWVTLVQAEKNGGFAYGNNRGIERAFAPVCPSYVYLLNPDTEVRPGAIGALVRFLEAHPEVGITGSGYETLDGDDWPIAFRFPNPISELSQGLQFGAVTRLLNRWTLIRSMPRANAPVDWVSGASVMIRPTVLAAIGGLDENYFLFFEETDFCRRAKSAGFSTWYVPESRVMHIGGESTRWDRNSERLPSYWFESRRRYFVMTYGLVPAMLIDVIAMAAHSLGLLKRIAQNRKHTAVPYFIRDLIHHSVLWKRNRSIPPVRCRIASLNMNT